ncbi:MAG TPA: helix-turn-helix domain-containing protein [Candidatus Faecalibacterium avium]|nr:helix-turn-helix domain-containing protein [Candidatus Faecalibacterium avium]
MRPIHDIEFFAGSREERLPGFAPDFPYIASWVEIDRYPGRVVPWHWHSAVEIFYMEKGSLEYSTPQGSVVFPQGSGGFVNSNVLHTTPAGYIRSYRLQMACQMLARGKAPIAEIGQACGLGSSSYFGKLFRQATGQTPSAYRRIWQDRDTSGQE